MFQRMIDYSNANPAIVAGILCALVIASLVFVLISNRCIKSMKRDISHLVRRVKRLVKMKKRAIAEKDAEIESLKEDLFFERLERKAAEHRLMLEIKVRDMKIANLKKDKDQLAKWGQKK